MPSKRQKFCVYALLGVLLLFLLARILFVGDTLRLLRTALRPLGISFLIIYLLAPIVNRIEEKMHWPRLLCLSLTYLLILLILFLVFSFLLPQLTRNLWDIWPATYEDFSALILTHPFFGRFLRQETLDALFESVPYPSAETLPRLLLDSSSLLRNITASLYESLCEIGIWAVALVMAFYALMSTRSLGRSAADFLYQTIPTVWADRLLRLLYLIDRALRDFVISKAFTCFLLGVLVYLGILVTNLFFRLSIPYPFLQAFLTAFFNLIPYIGPLLGLFPCLILALFQGWPETVALLALLLLMQQVDNLILEPRILSRSVGISPFWTLASVTCLGLLFNPFAAVFAVPVASVCRTLVQRYQEAYRRRRDKKTTTEKTDFGCCVGIPPSWQTQRRVTPEEPADLEKR
jgi:predicted PurR-regulated permease PerM